MEVYDSVILINKTTDLLAKRTIKHGSRLLHTVPIAADF